MPQRAHSGPILSNKPDICVSGPKSDCCFLTRAEAFVVLAILASLRSSSLAEMKTKGAKTRRWQQKVGPWMNSLLSFLLAITKIIKKERGKKRPFSFAA